MQGSKPTTAELRARRTELVRKDFEREYLKRQGAQTVQHVYEAPAAGAWVIIADDQAWVATTDQDAFYFWGPLGKRPINFALPEGW